MTIRLKSHLAMADMAAMHTYPSAWYLVIPGLAAPIPIALSVMGMTPWTQMSSLFAGGIQAVLVLLTVYALRARRISLANPWWIITAAVSIAATTDLVYQSVNLVRGYSMEPGYLYLVPHALLLYFGYAVLRARGPGGGLLHATDVAIGAFAFTLVSGIGLYGAFRVDSDAALALLWETLILDVPAVLLSASLWYGPNKGHAPRLASLVLAAIPTRTLARSYELSGGTEMASAFGWIWLYAYVIIALAALRGVITVQPARDSFAPSFSLGHIYSSAALTVLPSVTLIAARLSDLDIPGRGLAIVGIAISGTVAARITYLLGQADKQQTRWRYLADHDCLTGAASRGQWDSALSSAAEKQGDDVTHWLAILDFDDFKHHNDTYGHQASDVLLQRSVARWHTLLAREDVLARYGGEEFTVLLHAHNEEEALARVESLRCAVPGKQTCSAGLAPWWPHFSSDETMHNADVALYEAKAAGKNRTVVSRSKAVRPAADHQERQRPAALRGTGGADHPLTSR